jgi:hypothetical protein
MIHHFNLTGLTWIKRVQVRVVFTVGILIMPFRGTELAKIDVAWNATGDTNPYVDLVLGIAQLAILTAEGQRVGWCPISRKAQCGTRSLLSVRACSGVISVFGVRMI